MNGSDSSDDESGNDTITRNRWNRENATKRTSAAVGGGGEAFLAVAIFSVAGAAAIGVALVLFSLLGLTLTWFGTPIGNLPQQEEEEERRTAMMADRQIIAAVMIDRQQRTHPSSKVESSRVKSRQVKSSQLNST